MEKGGKTQKVKKRPWDLKGETRNCLGRPPEICAPKGLKKNGVGPSGKWALVWAREKFSPGCESFLKGRGFPKNPGAPKLNGKGDPNAVWKGPNFWLFG